MREKRRATRRDVAELAGVSPAVVSYVINGGPRGSLARSARQGIGSGTSAVVSPQRVGSRPAHAAYAHHRLCVLRLSPRYSFVSPYIAGVLTGLSSALQEQSHYMLPYWVGTGDDLSGFHDLLRSGRVDGVVLRLAQDPPVTDDILETVTSSGVPCVIIERPGAPRFGVSAVTYDDEDAAFRATTYLIEKGHHRVAHLRGDPRQVSSWHRADGYRRALMAASLPLDDGLIQGGGWKAMDGIIGMRALVASIALPPRCSPEMTSWLLVRSRCSATMVCASRPTSPWSASTTSRWPRNCCCR